MRGTGEKRRRIDPDPLHGSVIVAKFINVLMERGKKTVAQHVLYDAFRLIEERTKEKPTDVFDAAIKNVSPMVEVKPRRVGGANYQVPIEVHGDRRQALAFRWIIGAARARKGKPMAVKLAEEFIDAKNKQGAAMKKREDVHRMAESNRAFAHFA